MTGINQIPTDYKKALDQTLHFYQPRQNPVIELFSDVTYDPAITTPEYVKELQSYESDALGYQSVGEAQYLADGANPEVDGIGTIDATSTIKTVGKAYFIERKALTSSLPIAQQTTARLSVNTLKRIERQINNGLITNMSTNAGQTYSAGATWATTGDPFGDLIAMKNAFIKRVGIEPTFLLINPDDLTNLQKDFRMQNSLYVNRKGLTSEKFEATPLGLEIISEPAVTAGTCFIGVKGMFGDLIWTEKFVGFELPQGAKGNKYEIVASYMDQYKLPDYLMKATGI